MLSEPKVVDMWGYQARVRVGRGRRREREGGGKREGERERGVRYREKMAQTVHIW